MIYENIRKQLKDFYFNVLPDKVENMREVVFAKMDEYDKQNPGQNAFKLKTKLYETLVDNIDPVLFDDIPYYCETSALVPLCDGGFNRGAIHANGWLYLRNRHLFMDFDPEAYEAYRKASNVGNLYGQTQIYVDIMHIGLPLRKLFKIGLKGIYEELCEADQKAENEEEKDFLECAKAGIQALHKIADKFALAAKEKGMTEIYEIANRIPWEAPQTFHEGLCAMAFIRKALGTLEGVGFNSFGRVDCLLYPLYQHDIACGVREEELLEKTCKFLLIWDTMLDTRVKMEKFWEYELENTLTLGGCDENGEPVFNEVTKLFLTARKKTGALYPKMMIRYSANSPQEYLEMFCEPLLNGESSSLYENDDAMIPALLKAGIEPYDAANYVVGGCWDALTPDCNNKFSGEFEVIACYQE